MALIIPTEEEEKERPTTMTSRMRGRGLKAPHDDKEEERRRMKTPHDDAETTEQRSCPGMKMTESQFTPH